ncbi:hypothetical protein CEXT_457911, partial [Caerostris extrusa]
VCPKEKNDAEAGCCGAPPCSWLLRPRKSGFRPILEELKNLPVIRVVPSDSVVIRVRKPDQIIPGTATILNRSSPVTRTELNFRPKHLLVPPIKNDMSFNSLNKQNGWHLDI